VPTAAILAGGRAVRFGGRDKSALVIGGRSILERQIAELLRVTDDILVVGAEKRTGRFLFELANQESTRPLFRLVPDRVSGCGPLGGLDAALAAARDDVVAIVACDMPFVTAAFLQHLLALAREAEAVVPRTERGYHPLCAAYTRACVPAVARRLADGRLTMTGLLEEVRVRELTAGEIDAFGDHHRLLANVNSPADYEEFEGLRGH
jgi:molybdopterin-guanine dinucleotide biosynthesis protein A